MDVYIAKQNIRWLIIMAAGQHPLTLFIFPLWRKIIFFSFSHICYSDTYLGLNSISSSTGCLQTQKNAPILHLHRSSKSSRIQSSGPKLLIFIHQDRHHWRVGSNFSLIWEVKLVIVLQSWKGASAGTLWKKKMKIITRKSPTTSSRSKAISFAS